MFEHFVPLFIQMPDHDKAVRMAMKTHRNSGFPNISPYALGRFINYVLTFSFVTQIIIACPSAPTIQTVS